MNANVNTNKQDRHLFLAPSNVVIPDSVGRIFDFSFMIYMLICI